MPVLKHTHTYGRWKKRKWAGEIKQFYRCLDPHCTHTAQREEVDGKASLCAICQSHEVIMDWKQLARAKACCLNCQNTKEGKEFRENKSKADKLLDAVLMGGIMGDEER